MTMSDRRNAFLDEMGLGPVWLSRDVPAEQGMDEAATVETASAWTDMDTDVPADIPATNPPPSLPTASDVGAMDWSQLKETVANCTKCGLCKGRTRTVFGVGDEKANWLFVGEGPGRNEDQRGEPFVGQAGKLLDNMLLAMGLKRGENAYIANIVKCRPTDESGRDRPPTPDEAAACMPYLERQIALIQPTVIVALGKTAAISLLGLDPETPVGKLRGTVHEFAGRPLIVTYHPAYLLRNMPDKKKAWADLSLAIKTYAGVH
jgi:uracil-DNA glycosylase family 4